MISGSIFGNSRVVLNAAGFFGGEQVGRQLRYTFAAGAVEPVDAVDQQRGRRVGADVDTAEKHGPAQIVLIA